jgi:protoheme IX farnesyltransferase
VGLGQVKEIAAAAPHRQSLARDLVSLTKPRIISLLLVTTIAPMFVAGRPGWRLVLAVFVGGYLMAGGANAVNMYIDRDIDDRMSRTRLRPIPSGRMRPEAVLAFGILCATTATFLLAHVANVLTAALALGGFYTYVFVYTRWLKRSTPQNIVIGGAAGAFPPLVGWAAVTGQLDLMAVYLFLIVFYWTPPHFWALALNKQVDYGRAGVPMAPLMWGERETMRNMLWYTLILLPLTLLPVAFGALGVPYLVTAALLGGWLLVGVVRVMRAADFVKPAWAVYKYSLLYLALLFAAMVVDRAVA